MERHAELLLPRAGLRVANVGFGLGHLVSFTPELYIAPVWLWSINAVEERLHRRVRKGCSWVWPQLSE